MFNVIPSALPAADGAVVLTQEDFDTNTTDQTSYTFGGRALGAGEAGGKTIVVLVWQVGRVRTVSSLTVAGISATLRHSGNDDTDGESRVEIWTAELTTETSGNVVVTWSGGCLRCAVVVLKMMGHGSSVPTATAIDQTASPVDELETSLNVPANGAAASILAVNTNAGGFTWTGLDEDGTTPVDQSVELSGKWISAAYKEFASAQSPLVVNADAGGTDITAREIMISAAWGP